MIIELDANENIVYFNGGELGVIGNGTLN
jgi:hypothetical protein